MSDDGVKLAGFEETCRMIRALVEGAEWTWDERTRSVLAAIPNALQNTVYDAIVRRFTVKVEPEAVDNASPVAQHVVQGFGGGLRQGQELYLSDLGGLPLLVAAWWPWGDDDTVSIRLRLFEQPQGPDDDPRERFCAWFDVVPPPYY